MKGAKTFFACTILLAVSVLFTRASAGTERALTTLKVGHVGHDHQIALYLAAEAGQSLDKEYGVYLRELKHQEVYDLHDRGKPVARVHMIKVGGGSKMPAALEQGHIEVGLGGLGPVAKFVDKGAPIRVLAPLNNDGDALVLRKGFAAKSWTDFIENVKQGKKPVRIGYKAPMAVAYMILTRALDEEGIRYGQEPAGPDGRPVQVITVNLQGMKNVLPSLESGIVDGVVINEPMVSILVHKGLGIRVADLSTLPPDGKWQGHPCCIVAAADDALRGKRAIVTSFLKVVAAGADLMARYPEKAFEAEAAWTKTDPEVGKKSIPNVSYVIRPDEKWLKGVDTWLELMISSEHFRKNLRDKNAEEIRLILLDLDPMSEALSGITIYSEQGSVTVKEGE